MQTLDDMLYDFADLMGCDTEEARLETETDRVIAERCVPDGPDFFPRARDEARCRIEHRRMHALYSGRP